LKIAARTMSKIKEAVRCRCILPIIAEIAEQIVVISATSCFYWYLFVPATDLK